MKTKVAKPGVVWRDGKPAAVLLDIDVYEDLLERLEQKDDLAALAEMRKRPMKFRPLGEFLAETRTHV